MSEELRKENEKTDENTTEQNKTPEVDVAKMLERMDQLEATNKRIIEESNSHKQKYRSLRDENEKNHSAKLEKDENYKDLLDIEKNKVSKAEANLHESRKSGLKKELKFQVASLAKDAHNVDDILSLLPRDLLSINEDTYEVSGVAEAVNSIRESRSYLFSKNTSSGQFSGRPDGAPPKEKTFDEKILENPKAALDDVVAQMFNT